MSFTGLIFVAAVRTTVSCQTLFESINLHAYLHWTAKGDCNLENSRATKEELWKSAYLQAIHRSLIQ